MEDTLMSFADASPFQWTLQQFARAPDEELFQAAMREMVVTSFVLFKAGYFLSLAKCSLIPEQFMTYLVIDCKTVNNSTLMEVNAGLKKMVMWTEFLAQNRGAPWKTFHNIQRSLLKNFLLICFSKTFKSRKGKRYPFYDGSWHSTGPPRKDSQLQN